MALTTKKIEFIQGDYTLSTDTERLDLNAIHQYLSHESYWAQGVPLEVVKRSAENSLCFGIYHSNKQVAFARVVSDMATFAWIADVFVLPEHRKRGLSKWMMEAILAHPDLQGLRNWFLATRDAHSLYARYGFKAIEHPERLMAIRRPDIHRS